jgi:hypothetical protein
VRISIRTRTIVNIMILLHLRHHGPPSCAWQGVRREDVLVVQDGNLQAIKDVVQEAGVRLHQNQVRRVYYAAPSHFALSMGHRVIRGW